MRILEAFFTRNCLKLNKTSINTHLGKTLPFYHIHFNSSKGRVVRASASGAVDNFGIDSGQTNDLKIGIHSLPV